MPQYIKKSYRLGGSTKSSFLSLIPKEENPSSFSKLCPISLCNASYKTTMKIMENGLRKVLPNLILENQGGFLLKNANGAQNQCVSRGHLIQQSQSGNEHDNQDRHDERLQ